MRGGHTEEVVEEFTDVLVRLESIVDGRLKFSIHVTEVELKSAVAQHVGSTIAYFSVKSQEDLIYSSALPGLGRVIGLTILNKNRDELWIRPFT
jgi:hypothetical protein